MAGHKLDPIDRMILAELQADGRMTNVELAKRVGISAPPCLRRVRTLEEMGLIRGYHADVDARALGFEVQVFAMVGLVSQAESDLTAFEEKCREWSLVRECHMLNGEVDFILKCVAPDLSTFQSFLTEDLLTTPNVGSVKTSLVIRGAKDDPGVPFDVLEARMAETPDLPAYRLSHGPSGILQSTEQDFAKKFLGRSCSRHLSLRPHAPVLFGFEGAFEPSLLQCLMQSVR